MSAPDPMDLGRSEEARRVADLLLSSSVASSLDSSLHSQTPSLPSYGSYLHHSYPPYTAPPYLHMAPPLAMAHTRIPVIITDDLVSGTQQHGRMSPVRRFFILFCTFDILFTSLLWTIAILVTGRDLTRELYQQVMEYTIHSSMFDCVMAASFRFLVCVSFYGVLDMSHWWPITVSTASTVAFLIAKVFQYQWQTGEPITYDVMLVLCTFVLAWGEVWFYDFRMIPLERKAKEIFRDYPRRAGLEDERIPLLARSSSDGGGMIQRFMTGSTLYEGSVGHFYSPCGSSNSSDTEEDEDDNLVMGVRVPERFKRKKNHSFTSQEREFLAKGEEILVTAWDLLNSGGWRLENQLENGDRVQVKLVNGKRVFKLSGYVSVSPILLLEELFYNIEQAPSWNPTLVDCRIIQHLDECTDISYQVCAEAVGGMISTRDFVNIRHWGVVDGVYVSAGGSVLHQAMPLQPNKVRGENRPGCFAMRPVEGHPDICLFQWLLDTDLKGWIPQAIVDMALSGVQLDFIDRVRTRATGICSSGQS